ncbi:MAG: four-helix bundle copper-binding protein [Roseiflexaceae bacterium]
MTQTMTSTSRMIETNPSKPVVDGGTLAECITACFACAQTCTACADACLGEQDPAKQARCIRLNLDCADICLATGQVLSRQTAFDATTARAILQACATSCKQCGDVCQRHGDHGMEHCRVCAEACRRCEQACIQMISALAA